MQGTLTTHTLFSALAALALAGLAWSGPSLAADGEDDFSIRWTNQLSTNDVRYNALSANQAANLKMGQVSLSSASYARGSGDPDLRDQLQDERARRFMEYLVSCALGPDGLVQWNDGAGNAYEWRGSIGLCPGWGTGPATPECLRWVSACILARNNALGRRVLLSARGYMPVNPYLFEPMPAVRTDPFELYTDTPVASTEACSSRTIGPRDCGWKLDLVGRCQAGRTVEVGGGGTPPRSVKGPLGTTLEGSNMLRVCDGLGACDASAALAESDGSSGTQPPAVSFTCPASETFGVLVAPIDSGTSGQMLLAARDAASFPGPAFPASEETAFPIREGAFFGTLFGPGALNPGINIEVDPGASQISPTMVVIYQKMFSCQDPEFSNADAYATSRLCTSGGQHCVAKALGRCSAFAYGAPRCRRDNVAGIGEYGDCVDPAGIVHPQVVTTYLNTGCDLVGEPACHRD